MRRIEPRSWALAVRVFAKDLLAYCDAVEEENTFRPKNHNQYAVHDEMNGPHGLCSWIADLQSLRPPLENEDE